MKLPNYLKKALDTVIAEHPEYATKEGATGMCVVASDELLFMCDEIKGSVIDGYLEGDDTPHHWAVVENICIDLTARQFDEKAPFPKIWKKSLN
ncbi:hypothetical protein DWW69_16075 [Bacteroides sp. AF16-49]|uniref:hypothetical protein n=1 Tax=Bacteroides sp. AF16-49 TaxID=2292192 RepID=UPI000F005A1B|nr:hypothetical protein [Bacteroides sp. AF16-49]RHR72412.1 hypothetical protein DWW69_16075 [Bacteroides sp. AF16-49]